MSVIKTYLSIDEMKKQWNGRVYYRKNFEDSYGYVYVCEYGNDIKIGCSMNPKTRLLTHESNARIYGGKTVGRIAITSIGFQHYRDFEYIMHDIFREKRKTDFGELFDISFNAVIPSFETEFSTFLAFLKEDNIVKKNPFDDVTCDYFQYLREINA